MRYENCYAGSGLVSPEANVSMWKIVWGWINATMQWLLSFLVALCVLLVLLQKISEVINVTYVGMYFLEMCRILLLKVEVSPIITARIVSANRTRAIKRKRADVLMVTRISQFGTVIFPVHRENWILLIVEERCLTLLAHALHWWRGSALLTGNSFLTHLMKPEFSVVNESDAFS